MSYLAIAGTVISAGTAVYSANQQKKAQKKAQSAQANAGQGINFGEKPKAAEYVPVNFNAEQLATIQGNRQSAKEAAKLAMTTNSFIDTDAMNRARKFIPGYENSMSLEGDATNDLLNGRLPYEDVLGIARNRNGLSSSLGTPGASAPATLRDLGLSRLDAIGKGSSLFSTMISQADSVNPVSRRMLPQSMYLDPMQRISAAMSQNQVIQQSQQNKNNIEAGLSPNETANAQLALNAALMGASAPSNGAGSAIAGAVGTGLSSLAGQYLGNKGAGGTGLMDSGFYSSPSAAAAAYGYGSGYQPQIVKNPNGAGFYSPYSIPIS